IGCRALSCLPMAKSKPSRRRDIIRHARSRRAGIFWRQARGYGWAVLFVLVLTLGGSLIAISGESRARRQVGEINPRAVVSRVDLDAEDPDQTRQRKIDARDREPARYVANAQYYNRLREKLLALGEADADGAVKGVDFKLSAED